MARVLIVGGGITGLATAYYLQQKARGQGLPLALTLTEASPSWGGKIVTERQDGFLIEGGPDSFVTFKPWAIQLCKELALTERLLPVKDAQTRFFVVRRGRLVPFPSGLFPLMPTKIAPLLRSPLLSWKAKLRMGLEPFIPSRQDGGDESLAQFVRRRLGQEALEVLAEPLLGSIYATDLERMSLLSAFPRFRDLERQYGSLFRAAFASRIGDPVRAVSREYPMFMTLQDGLGELVEALVHRLSGHTLLLQHRVIRINHVLGASSGYRADLEDGRSLEEVAVVVTTPAYAAADLLAGLDGTLAAFLKTIPYASTITVSLGYRAADLSRPLDGTGFVVPRREGRRIRACTWSSAKFDARAPEGYFLLRAFIDGETAEHLLAREDGEVIQVVREELRDFMGLAGEPMLTRVHRWVQAHPQYEVGHLDRVREIEGRLAAHPGLFLAGSAYHGIGLPDCIRDAETTAERVAIWIRQLPPT